MTDTPQRPLAIVTCASSGIGFELAKLLAAEGHDLAIAADRPLGDAEATIRKAGAEVALSLQIDLSQPSGVDALFEKVQALGRPVDILCANAGHGLVQRPRQTIHVCLGQSCTSSIRQCTDSAEAFASTESVH